MPELLTGKRPTDAHHATSASFRLAKVITKTLPPVAPPPRSVIIENLPRLPEKPRDVIIERWIPYEAMYKRPVVIHRAKPPKPYPTPRNVIIT